MMTLWETVLPSGARLAIVQPTAGMACLLTLDRVLLARFITAGEARTAAAAFRQWGHAPTDLLLLAQAAGALADLPGVSAAKQARDQLLQVISARVARLEVELPDLNEASPEHATQRLPPLTAAREGALEPYLWDIEKGEAARGPG